MGRSQLNGVFPPCITPFDESQDVSYDGIRRNIERYNVTGIRGYMPLGTNGEFRSLTDEESLRVLAVYAEYRGREKTIIAGAGRESTKGTIEFIKKVADTGADFASLLPPHYFAPQMNDDALIGYFTDVADAAPIPILLYNIPKYAAGVIFSERLITTVASHPNIVGLKDTSSADITTYIRAIPDGDVFWVLAGTINKFFAGLQAGAIGGVLSIADYLPQMCCELQELYESGHRSEAARLDLYMRELSSKAAGRHGVAGVKAAMDILGYCGGAPRLPLSPISKQDRDDLDLVLRTEGLVPPAL